MQYVWKSKLYIHFCKTVFKTAKFVYSGANLLRMPTRVETTYRSDTLKRVLNITSEASFRSMPERNERRSDWYKVYRCIAEVKKKLNIYMYSLRKDFLQLSIPNFDVSERSTWINKGQYIPLITKIIVTLYHYNIYVSKKCYRIHTALHLDIL